MTIPHMLEVDDPIVLARVYRANVGLMTPEELATMLGVNVEALETWRGKGTGPDYVKLGRGVFYRVADVESWIDGSVVPVGRGVGSRIIAAVKDAIAGGLERIDTEGQTWVRDYRLPDDPSTAEPKVMGDNW